LIARTPRVTCCAGAAGVGSVFGMGEVYRGGFLGFLKAFFSEIIELELFPHPMGYLTERYV